MSKTIYLALLISFVIGAICGPIFIPFLTRLKCGQTVRDDGPESHLKKTGTPTMGGIIFLTGFTITSVIFSIWYPSIIPVMIMTLGFAVVGFIDDYVKVVKKRSMGLNAPQKMALEFIVAIAFAIYMSKISGIGFAMRIPFTNGFYWDAGWLGVVIFFLAVLGTVNGSNFTDGVDGLSTSVTIAIVAFFAVIAIIEKNDVAPAALAFIGGLMAFLLFNLHPAKVFMGDTGSLALGGFVVATAYMLQMPIYILIVAFIYFAEVLSVIIQVGYFKISHGKRVFRMAPIHHHFELGGWSETKVVGVFTIVSMILAVVAYIGY